MCVSEAYRALKSEACQRFVELIWNVSVTLQLKKDTNNSNAFQSNGLNRTMTLDNVLARL